MLAEQKSRKVTNFLQNVSIALFHFKKSALQVEIF